jgi:hypothetical protein
METKHAGGRPLIFKTVEELQEKIQAYFDDCKPHPEEHIVYRWKKKIEMKRMRDVEKGGMIMKEVEVDDLSQRPDEETQWHITQPKVMTVSALAVWLGTSRETLIDYGSGKYDEKALDADTRLKFSDTIKEAKDLIESQWEERLVGSNVTGVIFNLKNNYKWQDKTEQEITNPDGSMNPYANLNEDELRALAEAKD